MCAGHRREQRFRQSDGRGAGKRRRACLHLRQGVKELEQTAQVLRSHGVKVTASQADVAKADDVQRVIDTTIAALGRIDILANNAGTAWLDHALNTTDEQYTGMVSFYESGVNSSSSDLNQRYCPARYNSARLAGISSV